MHYYKGDPLKMKIDLQCLILPKMDNSMILQEPMDVAVQETWILSSAGSSN